MTEIVLSSGADVYLIVRSRFPRICSGYGRIGVIGAMRSQTGSEFIFPADVRTDFKSLRPFRWKAARLWRCAVKLPARIVCASRNASILGPHDWARHGNFSASIQIRPRELLVLSAEAIGVVRPCAPRCCVPFPGISSIYRISRVQRALRLWASQLPSRTKKSTDHQNISGSRGIALGNVLLLVSPRGCLLFCRHQREQLAARCERW